MPTLRDDLVARHRSTDQVRQPRPPRQRRLKRIDRQHRHLPEAVSRPRAERTVGAVAERLRQRPFQPRGTDPGAGRQSAIGLGEDVERRQVAEKRRAPDRDRRPSGERPGLEGVGRVAEDDDEMPARRDGSSDRLGRRIGQRDVAAEDHRVGGRPAAMVGRQFLRGRRRRGSAGRRAPERRPARLGVGPAAERPQRRRSRHRRPQRVGIDPQPAGGDRASVAGQQPNGQVAAGPSALEDRPHDARLAVALDRDLSRRSDRRRAVGVRGRGLDDRGRRKVGRSEPHDERRPLARAVRAVEADDDRLDAVGRRGGERSRGRNGEQRRR